MLQADDNMRCSERLGEYDVGGIVGVHALRCLDVM